MKKRTKILISALALVIASYGIIAAAIDRKATIHQTAFSNLTQYQRKYVYHPPVMISQRPPASNDQIAVTKSNEQFTASLYHELAAKKQGNVLFSPLSIFTALTLVHDGASGATAQEIAEALYLPNDPAKIRRGMAELIKGTPAVASPPVQASPEQIPPPPPAQESLQGWAAGQWPAQPLRQADTQDKQNVYMANALWVQKNYPVKSTFVENAEKYYDAQIENVDFDADGEGTKDQINAWVAEKTHGAITNLVGGDLSGTALAITNAVYFKGDWQEPFLSDNTKDGMFHLETGQTIMVPIMHRGSSDFPYFETDTFQAVGLPYEGGEWSGVIFLPKTANGSGAFEQEMTDVNISKCLASFTTDRQRLIRLSVPKFKIAASVDLKEYLQGMGIKTAFAAGQADLSGMTADNINGLYISKVLHKAFLNVDEKGTEAGAVTWAAMAPGGPQPNFSEEIEFKVDHPFIFLIRNIRTNEILFISRIMDPRAGE